MIAAVHLVLLGHGLVELWVVDPVERGFGGVSQVRWASSALLVALPVAMLLDRRAAAALPGGRRSAVREWFAYLAALIAAAVLLIDVVALVHGFLGGDLSLRFALKALVVALAAGLFLLRVRHRATADACILGLSVAGILAGLLTVGGPRVAREIREDAARLDALQTVVSTLHCEDPLQPPEALVAEALCAYCHGRILADEDLRDPVSGEPLRYELRGPREFAVCTTFHDAERLTEVDHRGRLPDFEPAAGCLVGRTGT